MHKIKLLALVSLLLLICFALGGCESETPEPVEITLLHGWGTMEPEHVRMRQIYEDFEKEHPEIHIKMGAMTSSEEVVNKVRDMLSVGEVPDIVFTGGYGRDSIYQFMVENNKAVDLMPYIEADPAFKSNISPQILDFWTTDGHLYTVSDVLLAGGGYWYNEEIFEQAGIDTLPTTWDEFLDTCDRIAAWSEREGKNIIPVQLTKESSVYLADALLLDSHPGGAQWVLEQQMNIQPEEMDRALQIMRKLYSYDTETEKGYSYRDVGEMFNQGQVAIYINGVWVGKLIDEHIKANYACFPGENGQSSACLSVALGYVVGMTGEQEKIDASVEFLKYLLRKDTQERLFCKTGQMPSNPNIEMRDYAAPEPRLCQAISVILDADRKIEIPSNFWSSEQIAAFERHIFDVLSGRMSTPDFLNLLKEAAG